VRSSELAAAAGVNLQTLRYYERRGLLTPAQAAGFVESASRRVATTTGKQMLQSIVRF